MQHRVYLFKGISEDIRTWSTAGTVLGEKIDSFSSESMFSSAWWSKWSNFQPVRLFSFSFERQHKNWWGRMALRASSSSLLRKSWQLRKGRPLERRRGSLKRTRNSSQSDDWIDWSVNELSFYFLRWYLDRSKRHWRLWVWVRSPDPHCATLPNSANWKSETEQKTWQCSIIFAIHQFSVWLKVRNLISYW